MTLPGRPTRSTIMDANYLEALKISIMTGYREHVMKAFGYRLPAVTSADELIALARRIRVPDFEAELGWQTDPPFPGACEKPEEMPNGWRMICACRVLAKGTEVGVIFLTLYSGRPAAVYVSAAGTVIPGEYLPLANR